MQRWTDRFAPVIIRRIQMPLLSALDEVSMAVRDHHHFRKDDSPSASVSSEKYLVRLQRQTILLRRIREILLNPALWNVGAEQSAAIAQSLAMSTEAYPLERFTLYKDAWEEMQHNYMLRQLFAADGPIRAVEKILEATYLRELSVDFLSNMLLDSRLPALSSAIDSGLKHLNGTIYRNGKNGLWSAADVHRYLLFARQYMCKLLDEAIGKTALANKLLSEFADLKGL